MKRQNANKTSEYYCKEIFHLEYLFQKGVAFFLTILISFPKTYFVPGLSVVEFIYCTPFMLAGIISLV